MSDEAADRESLIERISHEESRYARVSRVREESENRLEALRKQLAAIDGEVPAIGGQMGLPAGTPP